MNMGSRVIKESRPGVSHGLEPETSGSSLLPLEYSEHSANPQRGWRVVDGVTWAFTTDGHSIAFRQVDSCDWERGRLSKSDAMLSAMRGAISAPKRKVDPSALRAFLGEPASYQEAECMSCYGTGRESGADAGCDCSRCVCEECDGSGQGVKRTRKRYVRIEGKLFDAVVVATSLDRAQADGDVSIGVTDYGGGAVVMSGDGWLTLAMGVRGCDETDQAPSLEDHADLGSAVPS